MSSDWPPPIDWELPAKTGLLARLVGPGASIAERLLTFIFAGVSAAFLLTAALLSQWDWTWPQLAVATFLAFDLAGGIVTNMTAAGKRWYHRPDRSWFDHLKFLAAHSVHLALVAIAFFPNAWGLAVSGFAYVLSAGLLQMAVPLYLRRPVAAVQVLVGCALSVYIVDTPPYLEWVLPALFFKLLMGYLPMEVPFSSAHR